MNGKIAVKLAVVLLLALAFSDFESKAQPSLSDIQLDTWNFNNTNWFSDSGDAPLSFTNLDNPTNWDGNALQVDSTNVAWLEYSLVETNDFGGSTTNLTFNAGSIELWVLPDWNSGTGPGDAGRLIDVGEYSTNNPSSWWSLYVNDTGTSLSFSSETNGVFTNYLNYPILWNTNTWHFLALTYDSSESQLYVDGQLATNGAGVVYEPSTNVTGFFVGSDVTGTQQFHGRIDDLATYNFIITTDEITNDYGDGLQIMGTDYTNSTPPFPEGDLDDGGMTSSSPDYALGSNLWVAVFGISNSVTGLMLSNSVPDILYEVQGINDLTLAPTGWFSEGFVYGSELTNWTPASVWASQQTNLFLRIRSWVDSTGTGIPDWWWLTYFGQTTNVDAYASAAGDGFSNLQKYQMGLNPTNYYSTTAPGGFFGCLDITGTNVFLEWSNAPGSVVNYAIQRGIQNTNGNYVYAQIGLVSSNATFFEDAGAIINANSQNNIYNLEAVYPGGSLSPTDTWKVWWYTDDSSYGPPYGPPPPGNVYAYMDATGSNVLVSWTPAQSELATNYVIERGTNTGAYSYVYAPIAQVGTNVTAFEDVGVLTNANGWSDAYAVAAVYPGGGLSAAISSASGYNSPINVGSSTGPAAPTNFMAYADVEYGTNVFLAWSGSPGAVAYLLYGANWDNDIGLTQYWPLGQTSGTTFELVGGADGLGDFTYASFYIVAVYAGGSVSQSASCVPVTSPPSPSGLDAYVDATGTNIVVQWNPVPGAVGYSIQRDDVGEIAETDSNITFYVDTNEVELADAEFGPYGFDYHLLAYSVAALFPNGVSSAFANTAEIDDSPLAPPAPVGFTATVDATGTNVLLTWGSGGWATTGYTIWRGTYNASSGTYSYSQIGSVSAGVTAFTDFGAADSVNADDVMYQIEAEGADDQSSAPISASAGLPLPATTVNLTVTAQLVRNETGHWQLMFSGIPATVQAIAFYWYSWDYFYDYGPFNDGVPTTTENDIPVSSLTNGIYVLPDFLTTNWFPNNAVGKVAMVQPIGTNNQYGNLIQVGFQPYDSPTFVDGRQHLKQNLLYELRTATISQPGFSLAENNVWWDPDFFTINPPTDTNYVESSIFHWSKMFKGYNDAVPQYVKMDDVWPVTVNYELHQSLFDTNFTGPIFNWQPSPENDSGFNLSFQGTLATVPAPAVLGIGDPYWISQLNLSDTFNPFNDSWSYSFTQTQLADVAAYTNDGSLYLQSGMQNLYGLTFATALVNEGASTYLYPTNGGWGSYTLYATTTLAPGSSIAMTNANVFFSQTVDPDLQLTNYYFAPVNTPGTALVGQTSPIQPYPLPALPGFASTNQTGVLIASVGTPAVIGGWAKFAIQNGNATNFAYLGQYYVTNAFVLTNGIVTTNTTGVVSPYGDFFPMQAGQVAMVTMPDIDTGQQGTGVVDVIALNADANHDGIMDTSFTGPDQTSPSRPFRFWVNDVDDAGDDAGDGIPGGNGSTPDGMFVNPDGSYSIQGSRNLVNFFPVYLNIGSLFQSNALSAGISAADTNYQFVLSQADGALRFAYTDLTPTNYMNFLQDTNEVFDYLHDTSLTTVSNLNSGGVPVASYFLTQISGNHGGIILVEAWTNTTQPLMLTIYHGTNQIAQTSLPLSITGVEQMFRHKNILLNAASGVVPSRLTDASVPNEPDTTDMNFIFVHGYNVNPNQARGWDADYYKRLYWSGSHAKFYGVTWEASDSQILSGSVTVDLQTNIVNAFKTAPLLNTFLNSLPGTNVVAAHSLGNMLVLATLNDYSNRNINTYFMVDAAVAIEALQSNAVPDANMYYPDWIPYADKLNASHWWQLFPTNDARSALTWNNRLSNLQNASVYNFYSSGEEVLREYTGGYPPSELIGSLDEVAYYLITTEVNAGLPTGDYTWAWQEKLKGRGNYDGLLSSSHGGWKFSTYWVDSYGNPLSPAIMNNTTNTILQNQPMFDFNSTADTALLDIDSDLLGTVPDADASNYAATNQVRILSDAIPCLTLPVGANPVPKLSPPQSLTERNFDMMGLENGWPAARLQNHTELNNWHHSDNRAVAYIFTYNLFDDMVNFGGLK